MFQKLETENIWFWLKNWFSINNLINNPIISSSDRSQAADQLIIGAENGI